MKVIYKGPFIYLIDAFVQSFHAHEGSLGSESRVTKHLEPLEHFGLRILLPVGT